MVGVLVLVSPNFNTGIIERFLTTGSSFVLTFICQKSVCHNIINVPVRNIPKFSSLFMGSQSLHCASRYWKLSIVLISVINVHYKGMGWRGGSLTALWRTFRWQLTRCQYHTMQYLIPVNLFGYNPWLISLGTFLIQSTKNF